MTEKRFTHKINRLGMQFICYDEKSELLGTFADAKGVSNIVKLLNELHDENEELKHELETIKNILFDLKEIESYWDSSILQNVIDNIAETVGVDLDD